MVHLLSFIRVMCPAHSRVIRIERVKASFIAGTTGAFVMCLKCELQTALKQPFLHCLSFRLLFFSLPCFSKHVSCRHICEISGSNPLTRSPTPDLLRSFCSLLVIVVVVVVVAVFLSLHLALGPLSVTAFSPDSCLFLLICSSSSSVALVCVAASLCVRMSGEGGGGGGGGGRGSRGRGLFADLYFFRFAVNSLSVLPQVCRFYPTFILSYFIFLFFRF